MVEVEDLVVSVIPSLFLCEEGSAVEFLWGFLSILVVPLAGLGWILGRLVRVSKIGRWSGVGVQSLQKLSQCFAILE